MNVAKCSLWRHSQHRALTNASHLLYTKYDVGWHSSTVIYILGAQAPGKEVGAMTCQLILDWKSFAALGVSAIGIILAQKLMPEQATVVLNTLFDTSSAVIGGNNDD